MRLSARLCVPALALALSAPALALTTVYTTTLSGAAESPPNASLGTGTATVTIDDVAKTFRLQTSFSGLTGNVTNAHIHCCTGTANTGTAIPATRTPTLLGFPAGLTHGVFDQTYDMTLAGSWNAAFVTAQGGTTAQAFTAFVSGLDAGKAYLNIHSTSFSGGEIRGFLAPVPEPASMALMLGGLGLLVWTTRRRALI